MYLQKTIKISCKNTFLLQHKIFTFVIFTGHSVYSPARIPRFFRHHLHRMRNSRHYSLVTQTILEAVWTGRTGRTQRTQDSECNHFGVSVGVLCSIVRFKFKENYQCPNWRLIIFFKFRKYFENKKKEKITNKILKCLWVLKLWFISFFQVEWHLGIVILYL